MTEEAFDKSFYVYDENHRFAVMYPLLARQIVEDLGVSQGLCLDVGTGSAAPPSPLIRPTSVCQTDKSASAGRNVRATP